MPLIIERNDITKMNCDAVVNAANRRLAGGGGVDGAIHRAAGPQLYEACRKLGGCQTGKAKITPGFNMPCKYIIHTVGPIWQGGGMKEPELLASCYRESLLLALETKCESVAFPLISAGAYGYPREEALQIAVNEITAFLLKNDMTVYIVVYNRECFQVSRKLIHDVTEYIDDNYVAKHFMARNSRNIITELQQGAMPRPGAGKAEFFGIAGQKRAFDSAESPLACNACEEAPGRGKSLDELLGCLDESFSEMLLRKIDEKGMTDAQCYKKANIDRKLFSKIRSNAGYKPSKPTVLAFAIALELSIDETNEMLMKAGFALSHSSKFDVIVEYFIRNHRYDIFEINEVLFSFDQLMLG